MIEAELGQPTSALFASFDLEPLAAASIGQAHAATLRDGAEVIVKSAVRAWSNRSRKTSKFCKTSPRR